MTGTWVLTACWTVLNGLADTLPVIAAALLHEAGHALMCRLLSVPIRFFAPSAVGAVIGYGDLPAVRQHRCVVADHRTDGRRRLC